MYFLFLVMMAAVSAVYPCSWCDPDAPLAVLELFKEDARYDASRSALLQGAVLSDQYEPLPLCLNQRLVCAEPPVHDRFYTDYLSSYFPKADVITSLIAPTMCPDAMSRALASFVYLVTYAPWRYFVNAPDGFVFESAHVAILEEQLQKIVTFLRQAKVSKETGLLLQPEALFVGGMEQGVISLLRHWRSYNELENYHTLVALLNDTIIHRLYVAIKNEDYSKAVDGNRELQDAIELLAGSRYEQQYTLSGRLFADVLKLLHERLWSAVDADPAAADAFDAVEQSAAILSPLPLAREGDVAQKFLDSFISHYEVNVTGKFTHEYHPLVLEETARSFTALEKELSENGLPIVGRLTLMGYEEQGIAQYKTRYTDSLFSDEMAHKTNAGWSLKMFNRFGLLTGFLCKDVAALNQELDGTLPVTHINADQIEIFDSAGTIFQEHAFGEAFKPTMKAYERAQECLRKKSLPDFFIECMRFWHLLYSQELKVTGKQHVVGTQDILFSIAYMRYVRQSKVPMLHFFVGPDITYPIETSLVHNKEATRHAQKFVKKFMPQLKPINGKKTGYVFCSFVDGVGKSTMLGNIQNVMKHGEAVEEYGHVDNSSSQLATVFEYSPDVVIADLPAQVSHFTYKPDGFVYVDCAALLSAHELSALQEYVYKNQVRLSSAFDAVVAQAAEWPTYDLGKSEKENPELSYALNLHLLDKAATNEWISFAYKGSYYLFDRTHLSAIRMRVPLATAPSHGLKNCCPEQMIFTLGVRFPLAYSYFLQDLVAQLKQQQVEQIVMVDFISMYSRSSRENIRVNYVIQQLALLNKEFSLDNSFYQDFVHNAQLLALLDKPGKEKQFIKTLQQESLLRLALFDRLIDHASTTINGIELSALTDYLRERINNYDPATIKYAQARVAHKVVSEHDRLFGAYGSSREYVTLQQFNPSDLVQWSAAFARCMTETVVCQSINELWQKCAGATVVYAHTMSNAQGDQLPTVVLNTGDVVEVVGQIDADCHDRQLLRPLLRMARARWHAACTALLYSQAAGDCLQVEEKIPVIPLMVLPDGKGKLYFVQPILPMPETLEKIKTPVYSFFGVEKVGRKCEQWRVHNNRLYLHDWSKVEHSHGGGFAYGHELSSEPIEQQGFRSAIVSNLYTQFAQAHGADKVLVTTMLERMMKDKKQSFQSNYDRWLKESNKNGYMPANAPVPVAYDYRSRDKIDNATVYAIAPEQQPGVQLYIRFIATLDMLVKDLDADFAVRRNNKDDFIAHVLLIERITLPWLFGLFCADKLFASYDDIMPVCEVE